MNKYEEISNEIKELFNDSNITVEVDSMLKALSATQDDTEANLLIETILKNIDVNTNAFTAKIYLSVCTVVQLPNIINKTIDLLSAPHALDSALDRNKAEALIAKILGSDVNITEISFLKLESALLTAMISEQNSEDACKDIARWITDLHNKLQTVFGNSELTNIRISTYNLIFNKKGSYDNMVKAILRYIGRCNKGLISDPYKGDLAALLAYMINLNMPAIRNSYLEIRKQEEKYMKQVKLKKKKKLELKAQVKDLKNNFKATKKQNKKLVLEYVKSSVHYESALGARMVVNNFLKIKKTPKSIYDDAIIILNQ